VAQEVLTSSEAQDFKLEDDYLVLLGRPVDGAGLNYWGGALLSGTPDEAVLAGLLGSGEFFGNLQNATATSSDPNQAASAFAASGNLFQSATSQPGLIGVQFPAFGSLPLPAGFDTSVPGTEVGLFGTTGFIPANDLLNPGTTGFLGQPIPTSPTNNSTAGSTANGVPTNGAGFAGISFTNNGLGYTLPGLGTGGATTTSASMGTTASNLANSGIGTGPGATATGLQNSINVTGFNANQLIGNPLENISSTGAVGYGISTLEYGGEPQL
jgi:hypothetical protein